MKYLLSALLLFSLSCSSCRPKPKVVVRAQRLVVKRISLKACTLSVRYLVKNPHSIDLKILKVDQTLSLNKAVVAKGKLAQTRTIGAGSTQSIDVDVVVPYSTSLKSIGKLFMGHEVDYNLTSNMGMDTALGKQSRTLIRAGKLKLPIKPGGGLVGIKNIALENGGKLLKLDLIVKIPRPSTQMMSTTRVSYQFTIGGSVISKGDLKLTKGSGDFQKVTLPVSWPLVKGAKWTARILLGDSVKTHFKLKMDLGEETDFLIDNEDSISLKKLNPANILKNIIK